MDLALQSSSFRCSGANQTEIERMDDPEHDGFLESKGLFQKAIWGTLQGIHISHLGKR